MTYVDTSALLKILVADTESSDVRTFVSGLTDRLTSSEWTVAELTRSAVRAGATPNAADVLLAQIDLLTVMRANLFRAGRLPSPSGTYLRSADAIHLVAALELGETEFLTYDRRQAQAAERGFAVVAPGRVDGWYVPVG